LPQLADLACVSMRLVASAAHVLQIFQRENCSPAENMTSTTRNRRVEGMSIAFPRFPSQTRNQSPMKIIYCHEARQRSAVLPVTASGLHGGPPATRIWSN
jgi:hypothetical protein